MTLNISTSDGSWAADDSEIDEGNSGGSVFAGNVNVPAGTLSTPTPLPLTANAGGDTENVSLSIVQSGPSAGTMIWNLAADTSGPNPTCHASIESIPEAVTKVTGAPHGTTTRSQVEHLLQQH
jgi:hypothetical protein